MDDDDIRFTLRLPRALHERASAAVRTGRGESLNSLVVDVLARAIDGPASVRVAVRQAEAALRDLRQMIYGLEDDLRDTRILLVRQMIGMHYLLDFAWQHGLTKEQTDKMVRDDYEDLRKEAESLLPGLIAELRRERDERLKAYRLGRASDTSAPSDTPSPPPPDRG